MCSVTNFHMQTYDGLSYKFEGTCDYVLSKEINNKFAIIMVNVACVKQDHLVDSCGKNVKIVAEGYTINLLQKKIVHYKGVKVDLPFAKDGILIREVRFI